MPCGSVKDSYEIRSDLVYTSYFKKAQLIVPDRKLVSIARYSPESFNGLFMRELQPPIDILMAYKKKDINEITYTELYYDRVLRNKDPNQVYEALKGKVICCWEPPEQFCHRFLVTEWLNIAKGLGYVGGEI